MSERSNTVLRIWAIAAMVMTAGLWLVPLEMAQRLNALAIGVSFWGFVGRVLVTTIILVIVLGFYLRMLWECGFEKSIRNRSPWLVFLLVIPIVSAFIYYWVTRSNWYRSQTAN
jgi:hypothetical protein